MPVTVSGLGDAREALPATIVDASGGGVLLRTPQPIALGTAVRIDGIDILLLGEVCRCEQGREESRVAVQVRHCLAGLRELERLNHALLGTAMQDATKPAPVRS
jgi:PilZ domain